MRVQRSVLVSFPSGNAAMIAVSQREAPDVPSAMRSLVVRDFERMVEDWQDEASRFALDGNPERAHHVEGWASVAAGSAEAIRKGAWFRS